MSGSFSSSQSDHSFPSASGFGFSKFLSISFLSSSPKLSNCSSLYEEKEFRKALKEEAQKEINARQEEWNWKNRHRVRQDREFWEERLDILPPMGNVKMQRIRRMRQYRNPQLGIGRNTYNPNKSGQRRHITPKKYNGVAVHKRNYWSRTTKDPQEEK